MLLKIPIAVTVVVVDVVEVVVEVVVVSKRQQLYLLSLTITYNAAT